MRCWRAAAATSRCASTASRRGSRAWPGVSEVRVRRGRADLPAGGRRGRLPRGDRRASAVHDLTIEPARLEEAFLEYYDGRSARDPAPERNAPRRCTRERRPVPPDARRQPASACWPAAWACSSGAPCCPSSTRTFGKTIERRSFSGNPLFEQFSQFGGGDLFSLRGAIAIGFIHPFTLLLMGIMAIGFPVISIAGERQRGTLEVLLARPISRHALYVDAVRGRAAVPGHAAGAWSWAPTSCQRHRHGRRGGARARQRAAAVAQRRGCCSWRSCPSASRRRCPSTGWRRHWGCTMVFLLVNYLADVIGSLWPDAAWLRDWSLFHLVQAQGGPRRRRRALRLRAPAGDLGGRGRLRLARLPAPGPRRAQLIGGRIRYSAPTRL